LNEKKCRAKSIPGPGKQRNRGRTNAEFCAEPFACSFLTARPGKKMGQKRKENI